MNREQLKYVKGQIEEIRRELRAAIFRPAPLPKHVSAAKRVVDAWGENQRKLMSLRQARLEKAYAVAYQLALFGDASTALKALREFERFRL